jgi:hypothetical protein
MAQNIIYNMHPTFTTEQLILGAYSYMLCTPLWSPTEVVGITWICCPRHAGVLENEEADRLAVSVPVGGQLQQVFIKQGQKSYFT